MMRTRLGEPVSTGPSEARMILVRQTVDLNLEYLKQLQEDLQQAHHLSERIQKMKRQDLQLLTDRFQCSLKNKFQTAHRMLGDFCTMVVLHEWAINASSEACEEFLLCFDLLFEAHHDTFAWVHSPLEEPHPAGGLLRTQPIVGQHELINIHAESRYVRETDGASQTPQYLPDFFLRGLSAVVSEAEEMAASERRIEAIIELIENMSFTYGEPALTCSGTYHARRLVSTMKLHQMKPPSTTETAPWNAALGGER
jgi:hypothetical protein